MTSEHDSAPADVPPTAEPAESAQPTTSSERSPAQPEPRRLHPAATIIDSLRFIRAALLPLIIVLFGQGLLVGLAVTIFLAIIGVTVAVVGWRTEVYFVAEGSLHHRTGLLRRREQIVPATRISALDTQRGVVQRIFGIVGVQVQTAGGGPKAELELRAITFADAEQLRLDLGHRTTAPQTAQPTPGAQGTAHAAHDSGPADSALTFLSPGVVAEESPVVFRLTTRELLVAALTSPSIAVVGAALAGVGSLAQDALPRSFADELADRAAGLSVMAAVVLVVAIIVVASIVSILGTALLYGGFTVTRGDDRLRIRRGVLTERVGTVPLDRVHGVRIVESPLRQLLGYAAIEVEVAAYAGQDEVARTIVPLVRRSELAETLQHVLPQFSWPEGTLTGPPARARRRYLAVPLLVAAVPAIAIAALPIGPARTLAVVPLAAAVALGRQAARDAGWRRDAGMLTLRWRNLARYTLLAPEHRLQRASIAANPLQRRAALATFSVRLSSAREGAVKHLDAEVAHDLLATAQTRHAAS